MVPVSTVLCIVINLLICLILPVALAALFAVKYKKQGILPAWLLGAAGFFVTQILIRIPILTILQSHAWFMEFSRNHLFFYAFSLAFTAGLFELAGRFAVAKVLSKKHLDFNRSLAAGLGHGGIEAMVIVGMTMVNNLAYITMINSDAFDTVLAEAAVMGVDVTQLELIRDQLLTYPSALFLLSSVERILAMTAHTAMSMIVCYGVAHKKVLPCALVCLLIHTMIDLTAGLSLVSGTIMSQTTVYVIIYSILAVVSAISLILIRKLYRNWQSISQKEVSL